MDAKELRLGNIVKIDNPKYHPNVTQPLRVAGITETSLPNPSETEYCIQLNSLKENENIVTPLYSQLSEYIKPIPITEEILLKCGFIEGFRSEYSSRLDYDKDVRFHWRTVHGVSFICYRGVELHDVLFLHQLQNLYFSITNKELEVKL